MGAAAEPAPRHDFGDRTKDSGSFAAAAVKLEDHTVATYNGQAVNLSAAALKAAARIVSVEARHAAWIRSIVGEVPATKATDPAIEKAVAQTGSRASSSARRRLTATLLRDGRRVFRAPVGIGRAGSPTPPRRFYIRNRLTRYRSPGYGPLAFGTSACSETLTDWPADGYVGIHGTDRPGLVPGRVSHGCIRLRNADIVRLGRLMSVGTPVTIR